ncbi:MAG TPA: hypothetical protein VGE47_08245 [Burkholderiaceae bacterium]
MRFAQPFRFFRRSPTPLIEQDPADMGTAFGMEASLEGDEGWSRSNSSYELESATQAKPSESPLAWMSRRPA